MQKVLHHFRSWDVFGHPITIKYYGESTHKTNFGAFMTLVVFVLIMFELVGLTTDYIEGE